MLNLNGQLLSSAMVPIEAALLACYSVHDSILLSAFTVRISMDYNCNAFISYITFSYGQLLVTAVMYGIADWGPWAP